MFENVLLFQATQANLLYHNFSFDGDEKPRLAFILRWMLTEVTKKWLWWLRKRADVRIYFIYPVYNTYKTTINLNQLYVSWIAKPTSYCCWARISNFGTKITLILPPSIEFFNFWSVKYFDLLFMSQAAGRCFLTAPSAMIVCRFLNWNSSDILNTSHKISSKKIYVVV